MIVGEGKVILTYKAECLWREWVRCYRFHTEILRHQGVPPSCLSQRLPAPWWRLPGVRAHTRRGAAPPRQTREFTKWEKHQRNFNNDNNMSRWLTQFIYKKVFSCFLSMFTLSLSFLLVKLYCRVLMYLSGWGGLGVSEVTQQLSRWSTIVQ